MLFHLHEVCLVLAVAIPFHNVDLFIRQLLVSLVNNQLLS